MKFVLYSQNFRNVMERQVSLIKDKVVLNHADCKVRCHLMNADIEQKTCKAVECFIKSCNGLLKSWKKVESDEVRSAVGCLSLFSNRSQVSMNTGRYNSTLSTLHK